MEFCVLNLVDFIYRRPEGFLDLNYWDFPSEKDPGHRLCFNVWGIMRQIASGLIFIHAEGETHRDLKPQNGTTTL
jgi:hypothetical protein